MRTEVTQTTLLCDGCKTTIGSPLYSGIDNSASIGDLDYCRECSLILLEQLFEANKFTQMDVINFSEHYAITARRNNIEPC